MYTPQHTGGSEARIADVSSEIDAFSFTSSPLRRARSPGSAGTELELNPKRLLKINNKNAPQIQSQILDRRRSLDMGLSFGNAGMWENRLMGIPVGLRAEARVSQPLASQWQVVSEKATKAVVTVRFCQAVPFDTMDAVSTEASGFVVDKARGIILTNRHIACAGPFVGEVLFQNRERVNVHTIYRDPIHDFGFLQYSPKDVIYHDVHELALDPAMARIGTEIRIIGNDAGEELSILAGQISKVDRNVPDFGPMAYNDFNTFYLQAAASSSGGSSGSPVIDICGNAIGMQTAGRNQSATDFFMPLDRVKRALELIQSGRSVDRGDIQVHFLHKPFDYARRIGLSAGSEARARAHNAAEIGMLVAETVLPQGPGDRAGMIAGDVLVSINGRIVSGFVELNDIFDSSIGQQVAIIVERDGMPLEFLVVVEDINLITPAKYLTMGGGVIHDLSYQLARYYCMPARGVFIAQAWGMFSLNDVGEGIIIKSVDGQSTPTLEDFIQVICQLPDRARIPVVHYSLNDINEVHVDVVENERHWTDMDVYVRNDQTGVWDRDTIKPPHTTVELERIGDERARDIDEQTTQFATSSRAAVQQIIPSLVQVHFYVPWLINAFPVSRRTGTGLILDVERGLVVISRSIVPFEMGDLSLTVAESIAVSAKVVYLHPTLNFAIAKYNPAVLGKTPVRAARLSCTPVAEGDQLLLHAYNSSRGLATMNTSVSVVEATSIPKHSPPRFRSINANWFKLDTRDAQKYNTGILTDTSEGVVCGMWVSYMGDGYEGEGSGGEYFYGLDARLLMPVLSQMSMGMAPEICVLGVEFTTISLVESRHLGLDRAWIDRIRSSNASARHRQLLMISRVACGSMCSDVLEPLDVILELNGNTATQNEDFYHISGLSAVNLIVLRNKKVIEVIARTDRDYGTDTQRIIQWAGAILHEPHLAVRQQCRKLPSRVYVSYNTYGSPAYTADLAPTSFVTHVGDVATPDLNSFVAALHGLSVAKDGFIYVRIIGIDMIPEVVSVKLNSHYWPTVEIVRNDAAPGGWSKIYHDCTSSAAE
ncbi:hypothetical protein LPJ66_000250 [Kickxella alabastrina]|uniref:Uncharacterized protein n=1 Tax=Kickxella alabastrina TaxID=61397 RepID=A0ACC1IWJ0_9FUNG|nr:hypothetical protein LPJ66_000250 [Kickxella alabastrina]